MKLNKKVIKDLLSFQNIWMLVIILTIVYFIVHPGKIFQGGRKFKADHAKLIEAEYYIPNPQKENSFILLRKGEESTNLSFYEYPLHLKRNTDFVGTKLSFRGRKMTDVLISDEQVFFTLLQMPATMSLVTLQAKDFTYNMEKLYKLDSLFYFLQDTTITSNNTKFYEHEIFDDEPQQKTYIKEFKDGYRIYFEKTFFTKLQRYFDFKNLDNSPRYNYLVSLLNKQIETVIPFDHYDIYDIANFFKARNFHQQKLFKFMDKKFLPIRANILSSADVNGDGYDELLVQLNLGRFIANPLLCYDVHNSTILWQRRDLPGIVQIEAADIDEDGKEEFLCSTYAPCCEMPLKQKENRAKPKFFSYFFILGSEGEVEKIKGNRAFIQSKRGFYNYVFVNLQKQKKIVLGLSSNYDANEKNMLAYDYEKGTVDTLDIVYHNLINMKSVSGEVIYYDFYQNKLREIRLDRSLTQPVVLNTHKFDFRINEFYPHRINILDKSYSILSGGGGEYLLNTRLEPIYQFPKNIQISENLLHNRKNTIYFTSKSNDNSFFSKIEFSKNKELNPFAVIILLLEIIILLAFIAIKEVIRVPLESARENYYVIHSFFGLLYTWRLTGSYSKFLQLPKKLSLRRSQAHRYLHEISDEVELIYSHSKFLITTKVYRIQTEDEMEIIQRISHDLKNNIFIIKLQIEECCKELEDEYLEKISPVQNTLKDISNEIQVLSNFTRMDKLYREDILISELTREIMHDFYKHTNVDCVKTKIEKNCVLNVDRKLLKIALRNLISNAIDAVSNNETVLIRAEKKFSSIIITIKNATHISAQDFNRVERLGFTTKEGGSGLGIPISRAIIEKHDGKFMIRRKNSQFIVKILLPAKKIYN